MSNNSIPINVHPNSAEARNSFTTSLCANHQLGKSLLPSLMIHFILTFFMQLFTRALIWASSSQKQACLSPPKPDVMVRHRQTVEKQLCKKEKAARGQAKKTEAIRSSTCFHHQV